MMHVQARRMTLSVRSSAATALKVGGYLGLLGLLSACAGGQQISATQEASQYEARARRSYASPGPNGDPWGPYIQEAATKYDVPERWIREVMRVESGGRTEMNGAPITSGAGAMGLMQVMPATYDELRNRYSLGDDPYDPHNSILAGSAYIRELYDLYGNPGFLAAYNGGPGRLDDYLTRNRALPEETRRYVAKIGPYIADATPARKSMAEVYALNSLPTNIPSGSPYAVTADTAVPAVKLREPLPVEVAFAPTVVKSEIARPNAEVSNPVSVSRAETAPSTADHAQPEASPGHFEEAPVPAHEPDLLPVTRPRASYEPSPPRTLAAVPVTHALARHPVQFASLPEPPRLALPVPTSQVQAAYISAAQKEQRYHGMSPPGAIPAAAYRGSTGDWAIQVGAFNNEGLARIAVGSAREQAGTVLSSAHQAVAGVHEQHGTLYRARLTGLTHDAAAHACERLRGRSSCIVLSPDSQS